MKNMSMADLTAAEVQALAAFADNNPMTVEELARAVADTGMYLANDVNAVVQTLVDMGLAERTPAASLGKYRITADGRAWILARIG
jgi:DNA-binding MarR family transcriptional regulator